MGNKKMNLSSDESKANCLLVADILKTLSHPGRLMILCVLLDGEKSVSDLEELCGIGQSQVSQFLKRMQYEKIVNFRKDGKFVLYSIADDKISKLIDQFSQIFCQLPSNESDSGCSPKPNVSDVGEGQEQ